MKAMKKRGEIKEFLRIFANILETGAGGGVIEVEVKRKLGDAVKSMDA